MKRRRGLLEKQGAPSRACPRFLRNLLWQYLLWVHALCPQVNIISIIEVEKPRQKYLDLATLKDGVTHHGHTGRKYPS